MSSSSDDDLPLAIHRNRLCASKSKKARISAEELLRSIQDSGSDLDVGESDADRATPVPSTSDTPRTTLRPPSPVLTPPPSRQGASSALGAQKSRLIGQPPATHMPSVVAAEALKQLGTIPPPDTDHESDITYADDGSSSTSEESSAESDGSATREEEGGTEAEEREDRAEPEQAGPELLPNEADHGEFQDIAAGRRRPPSKPENWTKKRLADARRTKSGTTITKVIKGREVQMGTVVAKPMLPLACKCRYKCSNNFSEEERLAIYQEFCRLGNTGYDPQRQFVCNNTLDVAPKRKREPGPSTARSAKKVTRQYYLPKGDSLTRVCRDAFTRTLRVGKDFIDKCARSKTPQGTYRGQDLRGKRNKSRLSRQTVTFAKEHIDSFPVVESHYCRESSSRRYLAPDLNLAKLYRLYSTALHDFKKDNPDSDVQKVSRTKYSYLFYSHAPPLSFHHPKKDRCAVCYKYDEVLKDNPTEKEAFRATYEAHIERKDAIHAQKTADKESCKDDESKMVMSFDLQKVLTTPFCEVGLLYYKRKLNVYNFTVYESAGPRNGYCFLWNETEGKRGANEIASCLVKYVKEFLPENVTHLTTYSDTCGGQNRNQHVLAALIYIVRTTKVEVLEQKFMESGHSHMEVDSMHSAITAAAKNTHIYTPTGWHTSIMTARPRKPYIPVDMYHDDFDDYKGFTSSVITNRRKADDGSHVNWLKIKVFKIEKSIHNKVFFKYDVTDEQFSSITVKPTRSGRSASVDMSQDPHKAYPEMLPITTAKKNDLLSLVDAGVVPREFRPYYSSLPTSAGCRDELPESDVDDRDE